MRIVAFVGADGTGKSTQARMLAERLRGEGRRTRYVRPVFLLFDPWRLRSDGSVSESVSPRMRRVARARPEEASPSRWPSLRGLLGYLYALATYAFMRTAFRKDDFVVCDRYLYQYFYDLFGPRAVSVAQAFPAPDTVFWLEGGLDLLQRRSASPMSEAEARYYTSVLGFYRHLAGPLGFIRIDAGADPRSIGDQVRSQLAGAITGVGG